MRQSMFQNALVMPPLTTRPTQQSSLTPNSIKEMTNIPLTKDSASVAKGTKKKLQKLVGSSDQNQQHPNFFSSGSQRQTTLLNMAEKTDLTLLK